MLRAESVRFSRRKRDFEQYVKTLSRDERDKTYSQHRKEMEMKVLSPDPVLQANGIRVRDNGEGGWCLDSRPDFFVWHFGELTSAAVRDYLNLEKRELEHPVAVDGHLAVSFEELALRVRNWEQYLDEHPDSPYRSEASNNCNRLLGFLRTNVSTLSFRRASSIASLLPEYTSSSVTLASAYQ